MKQKAYIYLIILLYLSYFFARVYFSLQSPYFNSDASYFALRQLQYIHSTGKPLIHDELSYGGRTFVFMPLYFYVLSVSGFFPDPVVAVKILNNFFASTIVIAIYLLSAKLTGNRRIALLSSSLSALLPIYISETLNDINPLSVILPGSLFILYFVTMLEDKKLILSLLIPLTLMLVMSSTSIILLLVGLLIYILMCYLENLPVRRIIFEYISFLWLFFVWATFIIYKYAFQKHGFAIIYENAPLSVVGQYFSNIDVIQTITSIGILPFLCGFYIVYSYLVRTRKKEVMLFISIFLSTGVIFWLKVVKAEIALVFIAVSLFILFAQFFQDLLNFLKISKWSKYTNLVSVIAFAILLFSQLLPGALTFPDVMSKAPAKPYIDSFIWLKARSPQDSVIISSEKEGNLITYFSQRRDVVDTEFLLIDDVEARMKDVSSFYQNRFNVEAADILDKYNITYIIFSDVSRKEYGIAAMPQSACYRLIYNKTVEIYARDITECGVKQV